MLKRGFDILVSVVGLAFFAPLFVIIAVCLWFGGAGPVLYRQTRVGLNGRLFSLIKFRSMKPDAEEDGVARWASADDSRVTRLGRLLRRTRVDELPQIFNVLKGDMSFIGPRPERPEFVEILRQEVNFYDYRHTVKPGISGWAQLHYPYGASVEDAQEKLKYDLFYIKNYSLLLDVIILLQTLRVVIWPQLLAKRGEINAATQVTTPADPLRRTS
jgi:exopolysaccharide biosynthesis polyprenyl glycosylphosphotransferase